MESNILKDYVKSLCNQFYEISRSMHPEFYIHAHLDKVRWADKNPDAPGAAEVLAREAYHAGNRAKLAAFYVESNVLADSDGKTQDEKTDIIIANARALVGEIGYTPEIKAMMLREIDYMEQGALGTSL